MSDRETAQAIDEEAIRWVARIDGNPDARGALEQWLAGDSRRRGAFFRAQTAWRMLDRTSTIGALPEAAANGGRDHAFHFVNRRRLIAAGGLAAAGIAAGGAYLFVTDAPLRIDTGVGEIRRVPLADGSVAEINTQTRLAIALRPHVRQIQLARGEAWFQVAHDKARPFLVEAGGIRVQAVGTAFSVRREGEGATVQVTEGVVEIWREGSEASRLRVAAGSRAVLDDSTAAVPSAIEQAGDEIDRKLAWRSGQIILDGDTLEEAATEFNRYNQTKVRVADPRLANERLVGRFRINEPDAFARAVETTLGAHATTVGTEITLTRGS